MRSLTESSELQSMRMESSGLQSVTESSEMQPSASFSSLKSMIVTKGTKTRKTSMVQFCDKNPVVIDDVLEERKSKTMDGDLRGGKTGTKDGRRRVSEEVLTPY